ncbi:hypothetical protein JCGZ_21662 [Jatropha curcas]|uniref:Uncharacterized protein n=1 Tax=Jatropha curcas TaxID=180498 RepID=A0A067JBL0_JATCU|nr:hypothetical protein JCGZ_21662 [Jatropha curcas]
MPSGAKKRKAAKKKKQQANNNGDNSSINNSNPQGNDDPKSQDERESDGGDTGSPKSQDQHNQQDSANEENEESVKRDSPSFLSENRPIESVTGDAEGSQKVGVEDDTVIKIERELNSEQDIESKDVIVQVEAKELLDGDNKSSSSSSSDEEPHVFDKKWKEESHNSVGKVFPEEVTQVSGIEKSPKEANGNSVVETLSTVVVPIFGVAKHVMEGAGVENPEVLEVVEQGLKEDEDKLLPKSSDTIAGLVPGKNDGNVVPVLEDNVRVKTDVNSNVNGNEDNRLTSSGTPETTHAENIKDSETSGGNASVNEGKLTSSRAFEAIGDVDRAKDCETSEYTETQPLVPPAPQLAQRTSWMSCCGLFEAFSGSNR